MSDPLPIGGHLASHPGSVEYQIGSTLVRVCLDPERGAGWSVRRANQMFDALWKAIPAVIKLAEKASRQEMPDFWALHDQAGTADQQLSVWGVTISPSGDTVEYEVNGNPDFNAKGREALPGYPVEQFLWVSGEADGRYTVDTGSAEYSFTLEG